MKNGSGTDSTFSLAIIRLRKDGLVHSPSGSYFSENAPTVCVRSVLYLPLAAEAFPHLQHHSPQL